MCRSELFYLQFMYIGVLEGMVILDMIKPGDGLLGSGLYRAKDCLLYP